MSEDLHHECGVAALYRLREPAPGPELVQNENIAALMPGMLLDLQNRGQLAAGLSSFNPDRDQRLDTYREVGTVSETFRMSRPEKLQSILKEYAGQAAIGHTRYATSGADDACYAQPFERHHGRLWKWFSFAFNGTLANYADLRHQLVTKRGYHFTLNTDTEIIMHTLAHGLRGEEMAQLRDVMNLLAAEFDGAYNLVYLDALGRMFAARDPYGFRPLSWAAQGHLFAVANESVALTNLGFDQVHSFEPGQMAIVEDGRFHLERFAAPQRRSHCFFEWVYFSNVASQIDGAGVYQARAAGGRRLAGLEDQTVGENAIVVPVPDTAKAAADAYAYEIGVPCVEGLIRNRYVGRTFIQPRSTRGDSAKSKYTPLPSVLEGKQVFLVEDSIVRSTTLKTLAHQIRQQGGAQQVHVRVACPPIVAPCFYGIDMSTIDELFAPQFVDENYAGQLSPEVEGKMAQVLGVDSVRYLPVGDLGKTIGCGEESLCLGCVTGNYPTEWGKKLIAQAELNQGRGVAGRTYEQQVPG